MLPIATMTQQNRTCTQSRREDLDSKNKRKLLLQNRLFGKAYIYDNLYPSSSENVISPSAGFDNRSQEFSCEFSIHNVQIISDLHYS